ncbi:hypothetical protein KPA96_13685 [Burkholderia cenocepacia]|uniref:hypothetical protein n=1 Tax=Burkholderia cenocepacia TaxID=95486 RepID=UPI00285BE08F|nr:hypothetical protein [Burkholderia cenocepacia]MCB4346804.1 hypothetical protein [Burkholderia vietnamiensis]MDR8076708.1 hypothetical protein [Burkholderia cenocepacia]
MSLVKRFDFFSATKKSFEKSSFSVKRFAIVTVISSIIPLGLVIAGKMQYAPYADENLMRAYVNNRDTSIINKNMTTWLMSLKPEVRGRMLSVITHEEFKIFSEKYNAKHGK